MEEYSLIIADDSSHEKVFAEIYCNGKFVALVSQEYGPDQLRIEFPGPGLDEREIIREVSLIDFLSALEKASSRLL